MLAREHVEAWIVELLDTRAPATAMSRDQALRQWFAWLVGAGGMTESPMAKMKSPIVPEVPIPVLSDEALRTLLGSCAGKTFVEHRDQAFLRLFVDYGLRLTELTGLRVEHVDFDLGVVVVLGKGRRPRSVPFGDRTGQAVERWVRARATLPGSNRESGPLWMGKRGVMSPSGIRQMVWRRSEAAGIGRVFPHQLRHTFAHTWLAAGESEGDSGANPLSVEVFPPAGSLFVREVNEPAGDHRPGRRTLAGVVPVGAERTRYGLLGRFRLIGGRLDDGAVTFQTVRSSLISPSWCRRPTYPSSVGT